MKKTPCKFPLLCGNQKLQWKDELRLDTACHRYKALWKSDRNLLKKKGKEIIRGQPGHCHGQCDRVFI